MDDQPEEEQDFAAATEAAIDKSIALAKAEVAKLQAQKATMKAQTAEEEAEAMPDGESEQELPVEEEEMVEEVAEEMPVEEEEAPEEDADYAQAVEQALMSGSEEEYV